MVLSYMESRRMPAVQYWSRGGYTPGMDCLKAIARKVFRKKLPASGDIEGRTRSFRRGLLRKAWIWLALLELIRVYGGWIRWKLIRGNSVICDRYLWDTLIDFRILFPEEKIEDFLLWRLLRRVAARPNAAFVLHIPASVSEQRSTGKGVGHTEPTELVRLREAHYEQLDQSRGFHVLSGIDSSADNSSRILSVVSQVVNA